MSNFWLGQDPLVLASASKIRSQILASAGIPHDIVPASVDERNLENSAQGQEGPAIALMLAQAKAESVSAQKPGRMVLGADQTLTIASQIFHKPGCRANARRQLLSLKGQAHRLNSALALVQGGTLLFATVISATLTMRNFSEAFLDNYLNAAGPDIFSSVGCYHIEGIGIHLFDKIDGDQFTIMGLPLIPLLDHFRNLGLIIR